jgi:hypothetical protein
MSNAFNEPSMRPSLLSFSTSHPTFLCLFSKIL